MPINLNVGSDFDEASARRASAEAREYYRRQAAELQVQAKLDTENAKKVGPELAKILNANAVKQRVDAILNRDSAREVMRQLDREIKAQNAPKIKVETEIDYDSLRRAAAGVSDALRPVRSAFEVFVDSAKSGGAAVAGFSRVLTPIAIVGFGAALTEVAGIAASAAQSLWLVPAAAGAAGAALTTLQLITAGTGDAIDAMFGPQTTANVNKFNEALTRMSPNAQDAILSIKSMMPAFDDLKNATQDAFFAGMGQELNSLANQYLPTIQSMTTGIAGAFGDMFKGLGDQLMTPETQGAMQEFINNTVAGFQQLAPAVAPLTKAFADIMAVGSDFLPELARSATEAARAFSVFITEARQSGDLKRWMGEGLETLKLLGQAAFGLAKAFMTLAPTGEKVLPVIVRGLEDMEKIMPAIGAAALLLGPPFGMWLDMMNRVSAAFGVIKTVVISVANAIIPVINRIGEAINNLSAPIRALARLVNIDIPTFTPINQIGSGGGGSVGENRTSLRGPSLPTAGLDPFTGGGLGTTGGGLGRGIGSAPSFATSTVGGLPILGEPSSSFTGGGGGGASGSSSKFTGPMGTEPQFTDIAAIASSFGLTMGSGMRNEPGSFHSTGEAGDFSSGGVDTDQMLAFANFMRANFGSQLAELIYADPRFSGMMIDEGKSVADSFFGAELAKHHNHVHVAMRGALAAQGFVPDAIGYGGKGDIAQMVYQAALSRGYSPQDAQSILAYAIGESGLNPSISGGAQGGGGYENTVIGLFQQKPGFARAGGIDPSMRADPASNISAYLNQLQQHRGQGDIYDQLLATSVGGPLATGGRGAMAPLEAKAAALLAGGGGGLGGGSSAFGLGGGGSTGPRGDGIPVFVTNMPGGGFGGGGGGLGGGVGGAGGFDPLGSFAGGLSQAGGWGGIVGGGLSNILNLATGGRGLGIGGGGGATPGGGLLGMLGAGMGGGGASPSAMGPSPIGGGMGGGFGGQQTSVGAAGSIPPWGGGPGPGFGGRRAAASLPGMPGGPGGGTGSTLPQVAGRPSGEGGWEPQSSGLGLGGGLIGLVQSLPATALQSAAGAAGAFPGAGAGASAASSLISGAMQIGFDEANRAIGFAGQAAGIGIQGLGETFLPEGSALGDPQHNWLGKIAGAVVGARPSIQNMAGQGENPTEGKEKGEKDKAQKDAGQVQPPEKVDPNSKEHGKGKGQKPGPLIENLNYTGTAADGQSFAKDVGRQTRSVSSGMGWLGGG